MKRITLILLLAVAIGAVIPPASVVILSDQGSTAALVSFDVCHATAPADTANMKMPWTNTRQCCPEYTAQVETSPCNHYSLKPFLLVFQDERPPKA